MRPDRRKTLDELEGVVWGPAAPSDTGLVRTCHRLRTKPIGDFTVEDLRVMIGQDIGSHVLVPVALEVLDKDPLAEGDFYPGDLLHSLLRLEAAFWSQEGEYRDRLSRILRGIAIVPTELADAVASFRRRTAQQRDEADEAGDG
jgi:hypothetical protein